MTARIATSPEPSPEYVLGTDAAESARLALQNELWAATAYALWERAGIRPGHSVLDVGCGPGYASMAMARIVGPSGRVVGVDESPPFLAQFQAQARALGLRQMRAVQGDVQRLDECLSDDDRDFDVAYTRWVLCFIARPEDAVAGIARRLKPGGRVVIQDYFNYGPTLRLAPRRPAFERLIDAVVAMWSARGGDPDVGGRLPAMLEAHGLEVVHLGVTQRVSRSPASGDSTMWHWPDAFFRNVIPRLVEQGHLSRRERDAAVEDWERAARDPGAFVLLPSVMEIVARRR